ncbi:fluoride efflux transporter FluC [Ancrocorticia populi]|uniref:fluoride efflux transporter FluC n=1 Tax=Ancrocorticia populi TaxID=2175228 RepID=UPI003F99978E
MGSLERYSDVLCVGFGAALGTLARAVLEEVFPPAPDGWPITTLLINLTGSFLLGLLLTALVNVGEDTGWRHRVRLTAGTGVIGGFTTYSTLILEIHGLSFPASAAYGAVSILLGIFCAAAGILAAPRKRAS